MMVIGVAISIVSANGTAQKEKIEPTEIMQPFYGQAFYQASMTLPAKAVLSVQIVDVTTPQSSQPIIAQTHIDIENQMPIPFTVPLTETDLVDDHLYAIQARISVGDTLWFATPKPLVINRNREGHLIRLEQVGIVPSKATPRLKDYKWQAEQLEGEATQDPYPTLVIEEAEETSINATMDSGKILGKRYRVSGTGGCNRYFTTALVDEEKQLLRFSTIASTFMACADFAMQQESHFSNMMERVYAYRFEEGNYLYFLDQGDEVLAYFKPISHSD